MIPTWLLLVYVALPFVGALVYTLGWAYLESREGNSAPAKLLLVILLVISWAIALVALLERISVLE